MKALTRRFYELEFEVSVLEKRGNTFQDLFSDIMERCYPGDFTRVRPWGRAGDHKNDGYLRSKRVLFQVYAPEKMTAAQAIRKIRTDYTGALPFWERYFDKWIFVHNALDGLSPQISDVLLSLQEDTAREHAESTRLPCVEYWGPSELRTHLFTLSEVDIAAVVGQVPSISDIADVRYADIEQVVEHIITTTTPTIQSIQAVPRHKLEYNQLPEDAEMYLVQGMRKSRLVDQYFASHSDPEYGDRVANAFHRKYLSCRNLMMPPERIFDELYCFIVGDGRSSVKERAAANVVLAYLFEQCEIFERPPENLTI